MNTSKLSILIEEAKRKTIHICGISIPILYYFLQSLDFVDFSRWLVGSNFVTVIAPEYREFTIENFAKRRDCCYWHLDVMP